MGQYIVAELGTSHGGDLSKAQDMIGKASEAGADCAKFQIVLAREIIHKNTGLVALPGGETSLYEVFTSLERDQSFYQKLKDFCENEEIDFMATPFGLESWQLLRELSVSSVKIASPELNHLPLLQEIAQWHGEDKKVILSSGVSRLEDIERGLACFTDLKGVTLLHCITSYPAPAQEYNLNLIPLYKRLFGCSVGVSDHSQEPLPVPLLSTALGSSCLEKHFCLNNKDGGLDDPIALNPEDFTIMVKEVRELEQHSPERQLERLHNRFGRDYMGDVAGTGKKVLAPSEWANYGRTNRSIHAMDDIPKGTTLTNEMLGILRTEKILRPGMAPHLLDTILGCRVKRDIESGQGVIWEDLLEN